MTATVAALLEVQSVSKRFGGLQALSNVGFTVAEGEVGAVGYYSLVSMTLNVARVPLPDGVAPPLT